MSTLDWKTPMEKATGETPDISAFMQFTFWEKVLYYSHGESFPDTTEKVGRFLGVSENCGDALTFYILTKDEQIISRSVVRKCTETNPNLRATPRTQDDEILYQLGDLLQTPELPTVDPLSIIGKTITHLYRGVPIKATIQNVEDDKVTLNMSMD